MPVELELSYFGRDRRAELSSHMLLLHITPCNIGAFDIPLTWLSVEIPHLY